MALSANQRATAEVYASIPMATRIAMLHDLAEFAGTEGDPLVSAGIMKAARRILMQGTRVEREKRRTA